MMDILKRIFIKSNIGRFFIYVFLIFWALTTIAPLVWVINNSFKGTDQIMDTPFGLAETLNWANYQKAVERVDIIRSYINSFIMSGSATILVLLFGGMAAYILGRFEFKYKKFFTTIVALGLLIPAFSTIIPVYDLMIKLNLINTYPALILPHTASNLIFAIFVLSSYMSSLPDSIEEAAIVDGASRFQIFTKIIIPMSRPAMATVAIFSFLWSYNDLFSALILVSDKSVRPIVVLLNEVSSRYGVDYGLQAAAVVLTIVPIFLVYLLLQDYIVKGLARQGSVKG
ncbi:MAG: carbohydrate ABC transporter permease [Halanaerobiales bacterium]|nr:carbohydrate ABC transporter permease [Halanaerobiales bacterium]